MTADQRRAALLRSDGWLDANDYCKAAWDWHGEHVRAIGAVRAAQWEALLRLGAGAATFDDFLETLRGHLVRDPDSPTPKYRLGSKALTESLVGEVRLVALDKTERQAAFDAETDELPTGQSAPLKEWRKLAMARGFLSALVKRMRAQRAMEEMREWRPQQI